MDWAASLQGQVVGLGTAPVIYFIEEHPTCLPMVLPFFAALNRGESRVATSIVTLLEALVQPFQRGDTALIGQYRNLLLDTSSSTTVRVSRPIAEEAARSRAANTLRALDAIQLATAVVAGADTLLTDDARLPRLAGLRILVLDEL